MERSVRDEAPRKQRSRLQGETKQETRAGRELVLRQGRRQRMKRRREKKRVESEARQGQRLGFWTAMRRRGVDSMDGQKKKYGERGSAARRQLNMGDSAAVMAVVPEPLAATWA